MYTYEIDGTSYKILVDGVHTLTQDIVPFAAGVTPMTADNVEQHAQKHVETLTAQAAQKPDTPMADIMDGIDALMLGMADLYERGM